MIQIDPVSGVTIIKLSDGQVAIVQVEILGRRMTRTAGEALLAMAKGLGPDMSMQTRPKRRGFNHSGKRPAGVAPELKVEHPETEGPADTL
jgi:hypothetical protein